MRDQTAPSLDEMLKDPRTYFDKPEAVLRAPDLGHEDKLKLLKRWQEDEKALVRAASESPMTGGEQPMLREVQLAIDRLQSPDGPA